MNVVCKIFCKGYDFCCFVLVFRSVDFWNLSMFYNMVFYLVNL